MAWGFFNKLKNGIVKVAKGIGKVIKPIAQAVMPIAKEVVPKIVETASNAISPGMGTVAKVGVGGLLDGVDSLLHKGHDNTSQSTSQKLLQGVRQGLSAIQTNFAVLKEHPSTFTVKDLGPNFVPHAKGFIGKRR